MNFTKILFVILFFFFNVTITGQQLDTALWKKAKKLHQEAIVFDAHAHPFQVKSDSKLWNLGIDCPVSQIDFVKMKKGGIDVVFYSLPFLDGLTKIPATEKAKTSKDQLMEMMARYPQQAILASSFKEVQNALDKEKPAILLSIEYPDLFHKNTERIETYRQMGFRSITLENSEADPIVVINQQRKGRPSLSDFGRSLVKKMNDWGMLIDITHTMDPIQLDIIKASRTPVMASHSCTRAVNKKSRNIPDNIIRALAKKCGVIAVTFYSGYVSADYAEKYTAARKKFKAIEEGLKAKYKDDPKKMKQVIEKAWHKICPHPVPIDRLIDHIDHIVNLVGADYVGIGSDYCGDPIIATKGLADATGWPLITYHLLKQGYGDEDIKKILGGNLLRVLKAVEKEAIHEK